METAKTRTSTRLIRSFEDLVAADTASPERIGRKASSLIRLASQGYPVPDGWCVTTEAFDRAVEPLAPGNALASASDMELRRIRDAIRSAPVSPDLAAELRAFLESRSGCRFAVRSSGTSEDLDGASFAGLYRTVLNVETIPEIGRAIRECWASAFHPRVLRYCRDRGLEVQEVRMAVIVQRMVPAQKSGVLFSVDPVGGVDTEILIEACTGLGEALVDGSVSPDRYRFDWYRGRETSRTVARKEAGSGESEAVLDPREVKALAELGVRVQADVGYPVDLEWANCGKRFFLLQCRPVTRIALEGIRGEWTTADLRDGGVSSAVCSPFMASLYRSVAEVTMPRYLDRLHLPGSNSPESWMRSFFGRPYWNLGATRERLRCLPGFSERSFYQGLGIEVDDREAGRKTPMTPRSLVAGLRALWALRTSSRKQLRDAPALADSLWARLRQLATLDPQSMKRADLFSLLCRLLREDHFRMESAYFDWVYQTSNLGSRFREMIEKTGCDVDYPSLLGGLTDLSHLRPSIDLWRLAGDIRRDPGAKRYWESTSVAHLAEDWRAGRSAHLMKEFAHHVETYRHGSARELDITVPRFGEDPKFLIERLKKAINHPASMHPASRAAHQHRAFIAARAHLLRRLGPFARRRMARRLDELRSFLWWKEELRDLSTRYYAQVRRWTLAVANHLHAMGFLADRGEIFHLTKDEVLSVLSGRIPREALPEIVRRNRLYYRSFRNFRNPDEIGVRSRPDTRAPGTRETVLSGVPSSPGVVTATARVIRDIFDADRLEPGDILITTSTDPAWTERFSQLRGVATETGGLLSHAAVISREYGIPAVLAIAGVTRIVKDGARVTLDGSRGTLTVHGEREGARES